MKRRIDGLALTIGLVALLIAAIAVWTSLGSVPWTDVGAFVPLILVAFGLVGLFASHTKP